MFKMQANEGLPQNKIKIEKLIRAYTFTEFFYEVIICKNAACLELSF